MSPISQHRGHRRRDRVAPDRRITTGTSSSAVTDGVRVRSAAETAGLDTERTGLPVGATVEIAVASTSIQ